MCRHLEHPSLRILCLRRLWKPPKIQESKETRMGSELVIFLLNHGSTKRYLWIIETDYTTTVTKLSFKFVLQLSEISDFRSETSVSEYFLFSFWNFSLYIFYVKKLKICDNSAGFCSDFLHRNTKMKISRHNRFN